MSDVTPVQGFPVNTCSLYYQTIKVIMNPIFDTFMSIDDSVGFIAGRFVCDVVRSW